MYILSALGDLIVCVCVCVCVCVRVCVWACVCVQTGYLWAQNLSVIVLSTVPL